MHEAQLREVRHGGVCHGQQQLLSCPCVAQAMHYTLPIAPLQDEGCRNLCAPHRCFVPVGLHGLHKSPNIRRAVPPPPGPRR